MLLQRATIVWAMAATTLLVVAAYAAEATPTAPSPAIESSLAHPAPEPVPLIRMEGLALDELRFDFAQRPAPGTVRRLSPAVSAHRTGWAFSGRLGPLRWLTPIDGAGETTLRLGGRIPGQPHTPKIGNFSISVHYTF